MKGFRDGHRPAAGVRETFKQTYKKGCFIKKEKLPVTLPYLTPGCTVEAIELKAAGHLLWNGKKLEFQDVRVYVNMRGNEAEISPVDIEFESCIDWTIEDARIYGGVIRKLMSTLERQRALKYTIGLLDADRRDAELMHALTHLNLACPRCKVFAVRIEYLSLRNLFRRVNR